MIPERRPRIRRKPTDEMEIHDEDIIEEERPSRPTSAAHLTSGLYPVVRPPPPLERAISPDPDPVVRVSLESVDDVYEIDTALNDVTVDLVRLSLAVENRRSTQAPRLRGTIDWSALLPDEAWLVTIITAGFDVQAIVRNAPMSEEDTLAVFRRLIHKRVITLDMRPFAQG